VIHALIADDEDLAREGIRLLLAEETDFHVVAETANGPDTVEAIRAWQPDLVFLDVQMSVFDGFEVLERAGVAHLPVVVFVTAYDEYAVKAFEAQAIDYLLKPLSHTRFQEALKRVRGRFADDGHLELGQRQLMEVLDSRDSSPSPEARGRGTDQRKYLQRFVVRDRNRFLLLRADKVERIESAANYVELHVQGCSHLIRMTMAELEDRLDPTQFVRIHRSAIVNIDQITEVRAELHGDFTVMLRDGTALRMGRGFRNRLLP
jgi:two-component system LytT family response regulator